MSAPWRDEYLPLARRFGGWLWRRWRTPCEAFAISREEFDQIVLGALWESLLAWDPVRSVGPEVTGPYLAQQTRLRVHTHLRSEFRRVRAAAGSDALASVGAADRGQREAEARLDAGEVLRRATPRHREVLGMVSEGAKIHEVGTRLGVSRSRASQLWADASARARRQLGWEGVA